MEYRKGSSSSHAVPSSSSAQPTNQDTLYPHHHHLPHGATATATGIFNSSSSSNPSSQAVEKSADLRIDEEISGADDDNNYWKAADKDMAERLRRARENGHDNFIQDHAPRMNKLGVFSTACILINRMIGTGIFETPKTVWMNTQSVAASLFMWCLGGLITYAGMVVYLELGLTIPRYRVRREWKSIPRSGGEKNYLEYIYAVPRFLASCTYAVIFITLGNTAGNGMVFATHFLYIIRYPENTNLEVDKTGWICKGIAAAVVTIACLLHGAWRAGGIWVQNGFAVVKICILWFFIIAGLASYTGNFGDRENGFEAGVELKTENSFQYNRTQSFGAAEGVHGWIVTLLDVSFSFGGFESANYLLSEVKDPARKLKRSTLGAVTLVFVSYILANISFFTVVTSNKLMAPDNPTISTVFIQTLFPKSDNAKRALPALVAISAFGNLVSATFMNSKVKQEIAKEGVIPFSSFWRREYDSPFSRWFRRRKGHRGNGGSQTHPRDSAVAILEYHRGEEKTPIPALLLHWITSLVIILAPPAAETYQIFTRLYSFMTHAWFGIFLAGGLLYVGYYKQYMSDYRARRNNATVTANTNTNTTGISPHHHHWPSTNNAITSSRVYANTNTNTNISGGTYQWKNIAGFRPILGPVLPLIYLLSSLVMVFGSWIPPKHGDTMAGSSDKNGTKWYVVPTVGLGLFAVGVIYWFGLVYVLPMFYHKTLCVKRTPFLDREENFRYEDVQTKWIAPGPEEEEVEVDPFLVYN